MKKILIISHKFNPDIGGIESNSELLANSFFNYGYDVKVLTWSTGVETVNFSFDIVRSPTLYELIKSHFWADIIVENNPTLRLSWPNIIIRKPIVVVLNTFLHNKNSNFNFQELTKKIWLQHANKVISVSNYIKRECFERSHVVHNPYRSEIFYLNEKKTERSGFVYLGRLVSDKGVDIAIKAYKLFLDEYKELNDKHFAIIGDGEEKHKLIELANKLDICSNIEFKGSLTGDELRNELNKYECIIVPSKWNEPFGNVVLEGLACGCFPLATNKGGLPEAIGNAGLLFESENIVDLKNKMYQIMKNTDEIDNLKKNAPQHLIEHTPKVVFEKYMSVIFER